MIEIKRTEQKPIVLIRAASAYELSKYEKNKLASIEPNAQENKLEAISINGNRLPIDPETKEININLEHVVLKDTIIPEHLSTEELFHIKCDLNDL